MWLSGPPTTRLERRRLVDRAWQVFVQDGIEPTGLSAEILRSWRRARESYRIDPGISRPIRVLSRDELEARREQDMVLGLASSILDTFASHLDLSGHTLAYLDGEGWMLSINGDRRVIERVAEIDFRPGANWAENSAATNGPGTALVEDKPIEVFASEHYVAAWQPWSCAAAPIHAPGAARPVGLLDITGPWEMQRRQAILVAQAIAQAVEERIRTAASVRNEVVRYAFQVARDSGDALVAVDTSGCVVATNDAAARRRIVEAGSLPAALKEAVATSLRSSSRTPEKEVVIQSPDGLAFVASPVQFEGSSIGAILRASAVGKSARPTPPRARPLARYDFSRILGRSDALRCAVELAKTAARNNLPVVLSGESGTGKELFAQAIHSASDRQAGPFVAVNCGSIPVQLIEAELFGYEGGTFTGARRDGSPGRFEDADGGTLFLDEVSELPTQAQTALLRVLQEKEVVRLGGSSPRRVDVRIMAATNKPLDAEVNAKRFRRDLYYRLNVLSVAVPALRQRSDDVPLLAQAFLAEAEIEVERCGLTFTPDATAALRAYDWPGNVRELKNVVLRAAATAPGACIGADELALEPSIPDGVAAMGVPGRLRDSVLESERNVLIAALNACTWNLARAAQQLGISRMTLYRKLRKCGIARTTSPR